jgi:hypothetical protein
MAVCLCLSGFVTNPCEAAHWQAIGPAGGGISGMSYMDMDSVREEDGFRVALFLTIYAVAVPNAHDIKVDRITQETAFNCERREFTLRSTVGFFGGKEVGLSSLKGDWRTRFRAVPRDTFSQRALDLACNSPLAPQPEPIPTPDEAPGAVQLPGRGDH